MDFALNDDQRAIQEAARAFADAELAPHSARWDEDKHFPVEVMKSAAEMGFCGIYTGEEHGGMALGRVEAAVIFEELSRGDVATAAFSTSTGKCLSSSQRAECGSSSASAKARAAS